MMGAQKEKNLIKPFLEFSNFEKINSKFVFCDAFLEGLRGFFAEKSEAVLKED